MDPRRGYTLIELLAVMAIIAAMLGVTLPAIQKARDMANRMVSQNNMRQIGLAVHSFQDQSGNGQLPLLVDYGPGSPTNAGVVSLFFSILPQVEGNAIYSLYNPAVPSTYYNSTNGAAKRVFRAYINPADPTGIEGTIGSGNVTAASAQAPNTTSFSGRYATTSYAANGLVFFKVRSLGSITDGTSNTIFFGERYQRCQTTANATPVYYNYWALGAYSNSTPSFATQNPGGPTAPPTATGLNTAVLNQFVPKSPVTGTTPAQILGIAGGANYQAVNTATTNAPGGFQIAPRGTTFCNPNILQTPHVTGMNVIMGDASVRVVSVISPVVFFASVTPNGGEPLGGGF